MVAIKETKKTKASDLTTVKNDEAITAETATASGPEGLGDETKTIRALKYAGGKSGVNPSADAETASDESKKDKLGLTEDPLTEDEQGELENLKEIVREGFDKAILGNTALRRIRDRRLWRHTHKSFNDFCKDELDLSEQRVSQVLQCADEIAMLSGMVDQKIIPDSERAIRELRKVKPDNKVAVLLLASEKANGGRPNSTTIEEARHEIEGGKNKEPKHKTVKAETAIKAARGVLAFLKTYDPNDLKLGEITEFSDLMEKISEETTEKLASARS